VVPVGTARLRCQISAAHSRDDLDHAVRTISSVARTVGILK
jgi:glycine C-acetyltransferase